MSDTWENTKREAQSIRNIPENLYQDVHANARSMDLDTLMNARQHYDHILNYEIAEAAYEPTAEDWKDYERYIAESSLNDPLPEPEDLEKWTAMPDAWEKGKEAPATHSDALPFREAEEVEPEI